VFIDRLREEGGRRGSGRRKGEWKEGKEVEGTGNTLKRGSWYGS